MIYVVVLLAGLCVAYANGANDNFKGVATLLGNGTTSFRRALIWATATTFLGYLAAWLLAGNLIKSFGGKGLVDDAIAGQPAFAGAVALGAGLTVLLATRVGMPISTTHRDDSACLVRDASSERLFRRVELLDVDLRFMNRDLWVEAL